MTEAKKERLARELDTRIRYLRLTGLGRHRPGRRHVRPSIWLTSRLMNAARPDGMDGVAGRLPDLRHYAALVTSMAADTRDRTIKAPE